MQYKYMVAPDIIVYRELYADTELNAGVSVVDEASAHRADIRAANGGY
ncbi:MAG: hypothetical protein E7200_03290 [Selenomonas ruminantium]|nr:hypothetical protein [Selenomonas ruminantium]